MSTGQPGEGTGGGTPQADATDQGLLEAEGFVRGAWEQVLLESRDQVESALDAAFVCCDTAYQYLAAAQRSGDPTAIASAHSTLESALEFARKSSVACNRVRQAILEELHRLSQEVDERAADAGAAQVDQGTVAAGGSEPLCPTAQPGQGLAIERLVWRGRRWLAHTILRNQSPVPKLSAPGREYV